MNRRGFISMLAGAAGAALVPWRQQIKPAISLPPVKFYESRIWDLGCQMRKLELLPAPDYIVCNTGLKRLFEEQFREATLTGCGGLRLIVNDFLRPGAMISARPVERPRELVRAEYLDVVVMPDYSGILNLKPVA